MGQGGQGIGPHGCDLFPSSGDADYQSSHRETCVLSALQPLPTDVLQSASQSVSEELLQFKADGVRVGHQKPNGVATQRQYSFWFYTFSQDRSCAHAVLPTMAWLPLSWIGPINRGLSQPVLTEVVYNRGNLESHKCYSIKSVMRAALS